LKFSLVGLLKGGMMNETRASLQPAQASWLAAIVESACASHIAHEIGERKRAESELGQGATFFSTLPIPSPPDRRSRHPAERESPAD
jgi:hypothetical protein